MPHSIAPTEGYSVNALSGAIVDNVVVPEPAATAVA